MRNDGRCPGRLLLPEERVKAGGRRCSSTSCMLFLPPRWLGGAVACWTAVAAAGTVLRPQGHWRWAGMRNSTWSTMTHHLRGVGADIIQIVLVLVILPIVLVLLPLDDGRCRQLRQPRQWPTSRWPRRWPTSMHALDRPPNNATTPPPPQNSTWSTTTRRLRRVGADIIKIVLVFQPYYNILLVILPIVLVLLPLDDGQCRQLRWPGRWPTSRRPRR